MYHCHSCKALSKPRKAAHRVVTKKRNKVYTNYHPFTGEPFQTEGWEIVEEKLFCDKCTKDQPEAN